MHSLWCVLVLEVEQESEKPTQQSINYDKEDEKWTKVDKKKKTTKARGETIEKRNANVVNSGYTSGCLRRMLNGETVRCIPARSVL